MTDAPIFDSATVLLLRDGPDGVEVFMLERHIESDFVGGAFVFPGGKVDAADRDLPPERWTGLDPRVVADMDVGDDLALGLHVAAVRETFEEAGVLLARREDGGPVDVATPVATEVRRRLASRDERFDWRPWLADEAIVLDLGALGWWSWWVTPDGAPKRYDTRFFVALASEGDAPAHDRVETTDSRWISAEEALDAARSRQVMVVYPTRKNLERLLPFDTARAAWRAAKDGQLDTRRTVPTAFLEDGVLKIRHPHDGTEEPFEP